MFSTNGAGVVNRKIHSLVSEVKATGATVVTVQETHCRRKGRIMIDDMVVFEVIRVKKGGGTMCAIHKDLNPKLVEEYNNPFEMLVVEVEDNKRIITGYGPQENLTEDKRLPFFIALEEEIVKATVAGKSVIIERDANSKLGPHYIHGDPHNITPNGRLLAGVIERQHMFVVNGSNVCKGKITRRREARKKVEESIMDIVIVSSDIIKDVVSLEIDETKKHVLSRIRKTKKGTVKKESDHNFLITTFKSTFKNTKENKKTEMYNLKNKECQLKFKAYTSNTNMLSSVLNSEEDINVLTRRLIKKIDGCIAMSLRKVRITHNKKGKLDRLQEKMRNLKGANKPEELDNVVEQIATYEQEKYEHVMEELAKIKDDEKLDQQKFWRLKKKLCPKSSDPPSVMLDKTGNLLTTNKAIENRAVKVFRERLDNNTMKPHLSDMESNVNKLCEQRLKATKLNKTEPWTMAELEEAVKDLGRNKSRDANGHANELLKEEAAGTDFKLAILKLMNMIKERSQFPTSMELCNITSIYKNKGSHKDFDSYRGIFRVTVLRSILDRLMYNDNYFTIDGNLTDGNVGARKSRNIRDNLYVINAVSNSIINGNMAPIQVSVTDVKKCFDKLWLQSTINALYEAGITNHTLNILYLENKNAQIAIKINSNLTARVDVKDVVMQGSVWGSIKCTTTMDKLNKVMLNEDQLKYFYRNDKDIPIGVLGMVDDQLDISECGNQAVQKNAVLNSFIENQRLELSHEKSCVIHIGNDKKCKEKCPSLKVHNHNMKTASSAKYLGDIVSAKGGSHDTIEKRRSEGWGRISQIMGLISEVTSSDFRVQIGLKLRESKLCSGLLCNSEAWSSISERDMTRLEQVDLSFLRGLTGSHAKTVSEFLYIELGVLKVRHILTYRRLMYHHHIITREDHETIKKIYNKQASSPLKGDWYQMLLLDFEFIGEEKCDNKISSLSKEQYRKWLKSKIEKAAFDIYMQKKEVHKKKLGDVKYPKFIIQPYMYNKMFGKKEIKKMCLLRSKSYPAKMNFKKMYKNNLKCSFSCNTLETQSHIFEECKPIICNLLNPVPIKLEQIFGSLQEQCDIIEKLVEIDTVRKLMKDNLLPGGAAART